MQETVLYLRASTHEAHRALESTALARALMSPELTLADYRDVLQVWSDAWFAVEAALEASSGRCECVDLLPPPRAYCALQDIANLDGLLPDAARHTRFRPAAVPALRPAQSPAELLGLSYVAMGSSLGGKVIARHVCSVLQLGADVATSFFSADLSGAPSWSTWLRELNAHVATAAERQQALEGALRCFNFLRQSFAESEMPTMAQQRAA
jgi:heme oxygenase